jgi:hypothetical protein
MDPYLEGDLWPDVHHRLAAEIGNTLTPLLRPKYVARLAVYVVHDESPEPEVGILYPDVEVFERARTALPRPTLTGASSLVAPLTVPFVSPVDVRIPSVEIRDCRGNELVTAIELTSPVNKREPGLTKYRAKQRRLHAARVHLVEIDLLRRGTRPLAHPRLAQADYLVALIRAGSSTVEAWPIALTEPLPTVPVPLRDPDPDVPLDLSALLATVYERAAYELSIDYSAAPPPPQLSAEQEQWRKERG